MSYEPRLTAALSGVTPGQLSYWRRSAKGRAPVLVPEYATPRRSLYSFRDVIALRTVAYLREESSLQRIRLALETLRNLGESDHLSNYRLVATGGTIALLAGDEAVDLIDRPGHHLIADFVEVLRPFTNRRGDRIPDFQHPRENIEIREDVMGGFPVIRGTRVPYDLVADLLEDGLKPDDLDSFYPSVSAGAARDAADYAAYVASMCA